MKMGNIRSLWRYDVGAHCVLRSSNLRQPAISHFAVQPNNQPLQVNERPIWSAAGVPRVGPQAVHHAAGYLGTIPSCMGYSQRISNR